MSRWRGYDSIAVAIAFDRHTDGLVAQGADLARRTGKQLLLLHVQEPWFELPATVPVNPTHPLWTSASSLTAENRQVCLKKLEAIATSLPKTLPVRTLVLSGRPAQTLAKASQLAGCGLLLVGAGGKSVGTRFTFGGSTALSLLGSAPMPVAVIDTAHSRPLFGERTRLLLADDLGPTSEAAVDYGFELATLLGIGELHHVHVTGVSLDVLRSSLTTALAASHTPGDATTSATQVFDQLLQAMHGQLEARANRHLTEVGKQGGKYIPQVLVGNVSNELARLVGENVPDAVVFGRHRFLHTEPVFLGRVPFKAMLSLGSPLIVVPND